MTNLEPERGENVHVLMPMNYLGNIKNVVKVKYCCENS